MGNIFPLLSASWRPLGAGKGWILKATSTLRKFALLKSCGLSESENNSTSTFGQTVDGDLCEVPHICAWNAVLIESMFYPFPDRNTAFPRLLCDSSTGPGTRFTPKNPDQSPPPIRPHRTPVYIPTIPRYIDACLSRHLLLAHLPNAP